MARSNSSLVRGPSASLWPWLAWAVVILLADQFTKTLILGYYRLGDATTITSFFNIVRAHNTGAAFSFLADAGGWQRWLFTGIGVVATVFIVWQLRAHPGAKAVLLCAVEHPWGRRGQCGGPADARLCGGFSRLPLGGLPLSGVQHCRRRHYGGRGLPDPGRVAAREKRALSQQHPRPPHAGVTNAIRALAGGAVCGAIVARFFP